MAFKKIPKLFAIFILAILYISLFSNSNFTESFILPKSYYFYFLLFPILATIAYMGIKVKIKQEFAFSHIDIVICLYYIYNLIRLVFTNLIPVYNTNFINETLLLVFYFSIKYTYLNLPNDIFKVHYPVLLKGVLILIILNALYGIVQYFSLIPFSSNDFKLAGSFGNPGPYSNFLVLLSPFIYLVLFNSKSHSGITNFLAVLCLLTTLIVLPLTQARTAWICFAVSTFSFLLIYFLKSEKIKRIFKTIYFKIILILVLVCITAVGSYYLFHYKQASASGRLFIWEVTLKMIKDKPIFGHGYDSYIYQHNNYQADYFKDHPEDIKNAYLSDNTTYAFNEFLQICSDIGIVGLLIFLLVLFFAFRASFSALEKTNEKYYLFVTSKVVFISFIICSLFSYPYRSLPSQALFYLALAIISGLGKSKFLFNGVIGKRMCNYLSYFLIGILFIFYINQISRYNAEKEWFKALENKKRASTEQTYSKLAELNSILKYNKYFLFNYGAELIVMKKYEEGIQKLNEAKKFINDVDIHIYLGHGYEETGQLLKAEECFKQAMYIVPTKLYPKYNLVKLYAKMNRKKEAIQLATEIVQMKEKVETDISISIKYEMEKFLSESSSNNAIN